MITYGTDLNDISVTGTYRVSNQMKADNNPRHYLIIPGIVVQQILDAERKKKESDVERKIKMEEESKDEIAEKIMSFKVINNATGGMT